MTPMSLSISRLDHPTGDLLDLEIVELKGLGHPDTICDAIAEQLSLTLSAHYVAECGEVLHHNVDKALLAGGESRPAFGGGTISRPMELFLAGRATNSAQGRTFPIEELTRQVAAEWFTKNLPLVDVGRHVRVHSLIRPGSADLSNLFGRRSGRQRMSNDTSIGVGYAPLSRLEAVVYAVEKDLGAATEGGNHPEIGRDIKIMGVRRGEHFHLTVACAFIGSFLPSLADYVTSKATIGAIVNQTAQKYGVVNVTVDVNTADNLAAGSVYLTVTGTSAEAGDDGQTGRGNRINGLITPFRQMTMESVAGKNPVTHVGKLYNIAASLVAERLVNELPDVVEARCLIVSQIGSLVKQPQAVEVCLRTRSMGEVPKNEVIAIVEGELARLESVADELVSGALATGRWPLHQLSRHQ